MVGEAAAADGVIKGRPEIVEAANMAAAAVAIKVAAAVDIKVAAAAVDIKAAAAAEDIKAAAAVVDIKVAVAVVDIKVAVAVVTKAEVSCNKTCPICSKINFQISFEKLPLNFRENKNSSC